MADALTLGATYSRPKGGRVPSPWSTCPPEGRVEAETSAPTDGCFQRRAEPLAQPATSLGRGDKGESSLYEGQGLFAYQPARTTRGGCRPLDWMSLAVISPRDPASAAVTPPDFTDTRVTSVERPTTLAFTPDGRLLVTTEPGRLRVYEDGALLANPALDISSKVCTNGARFTRGCRGPKLRHQQLHLPLLHF